MYSPMKRTIPISLSLLKTSARRRKFLSALVAGILFIVGLPGMSMAANPPCATPNSCTFTISVSVDNQTANGTSADIVTITVTDNLNGGALVPGLSINMAIPPVTATTPGSTGTSGPSLGVATFNVYNTTAGPLDLKFYVSVPGFPVYQIGTTMTTVNFSPGPPDPNNPGSILIVDNGTAPADGATPVKIHAHLVDAFGNISANQTVTISFATVANGDPAESNVVYSTWLATTDADGDIYLTATDITAGTVLIGCTVSGTPIYTSGGTPASVTFTATAPNGAHSSLVVDVGITTANGVSTDQIHAVIRDANGNLVKNTSVTMIFLIAVPGPIDGTAIYNTASLTVTTDANGNTPIFTIANTNTGIMQMGATVNGLTITGNSPAPVNFVAGPPDATKSSLVVDIPSTAADGTSKDKIHAHLVDAQGHEIDNTTVTITFYIVSTGDPAEATVTPVVLTTTTDGSGNVYMYASDPTAGTVEWGAKVNATQDDILTGKPASTIFVAGAPYAPNCSLVVDIGTTAADGSSMDKIHAHLVDANGNIVANQTVTLFFYMIPVGDPAEATVVPATLSLTTDANGDIYMTAKDPTAGSVQWGAKVNATKDDILTGKPAVTIFTIPPPSVSNQQTTLVVDVPSAVADGVATTQVHVHLVGPAPGNASEAGQIVDIKFYIIPSGPADATANGTVTTAGGGAGFIDFPNVTVDALGNVTLTISDINTGSVSIGVLVNGADVTNGKPAVVTFVAGPAVPGQPGGGGGTPGGSDPGGGGPGTPGATGYTVEFVVLDHRLADGSQKDSVAAYVTDGLNPAHVVSGADIKFSILTIPSAGTATAGATLVGGPDVLSVNGYCGIAIQSTKPGTVYIQATLNGVPIDNSYRLITFDDAPDVNNQETYIKTIVYEALADGTQQTEVKVHVVSLDGSIMSGQEIKFTVDSGNAQIFTPGPWITDANGDAYIYLTSKTPGISNVTASIVMAGSPDLAIKNGSPARVKFAAINIYVPKVFTPNGDGTNDVLKPILVGIQTFHYFSVYNRWGNLVFTTQDPNQGWDGTFKGVPQPVETYLWIAEGIDVEGRKIVQKGMTSLVK